MGIATSLYAIGDAIDPRLAYWTCLLTTGKQLSEHQLIPTFIRGQRGLRKLDWALDLVGTGDIKRVKEVLLHCPDGRTARLQIPEACTAFQFKCKAMHIIGAGDSGLEFHVIGRVTDKVSGRCECWIWDYRPKPGEEHLVKYESSIHAFGMWRDTCTPFGALGIDVQGFRL